MAINVTIDDKDYDVAQSIDDLMLIDWVELMTILSRREYKEIGKMATSDEILKELVPTKDETLEFKEDKLIDMLVLLSSIPKALFVEYPSLSDEIGKLVDWSNLYKDDSVVVDEIESYEVKYKRLPLADSTFQHWCDFENFVSDNLLIAFVVFLSDGTPYNRYHKDFETKLLMFGRLPARGNAALLQSILDDVSKARDDYFYIYNNDTEEGGEPIGRYIEQHHKYLQYL